MIGSLHSATYNNLTFISNRAVAGGGLYGTNSATTYNSLLLSKNIAEQGAGISFVGSGSTLLWSDFYDNYAFSDGGGVYVYSPFQIESLTFQAMYNTITNNSALNSGGGIYCNHSKVNYESNTVEYNYAPLAGSSDFFCSGTCLNQQLNCACQQCEGATTDVQTSATSASTTTSTTHNPTTPPSNHGGAIAAGILVPLILIAVAVGGFLWYRRRMSYARVETEPLVSK